MNKLAIARLGNKAKLAALSATGALVAFAQPAMAEAVDVAAVVADIKAQIPSVVLVGGAVLLVYVAVKAFKYVRAALS